MLILKINFKKYKDIILIYFEIKKIKNNLTTNGHSILLYKNPN